MTDFESKLLAYLRANVAAGKTFFKSRHIANEIGNGTTPKQIGAFLFKLSKNPKVKDIEILQWSASISTTWRVTRV